MEKYYWDKRIDYLLNTRNLYYNDDYLSFLVNNVWKIHSPVNIVDFGCGYGFFGLKLLPLLPKNSKYTGLDLGNELIAKAKEYFVNSPYETDFIQCDVNNFIKENSFDIALCHALLLHISNPIKILENMKKCVLNNGKMICFEPHWISSMASMYLDGIEHNEIIKMDILQKLYSLDRRNTEKDGNIGIKIPIHFSKLGLKNINCRVSDKVIFMDKNNEKKDNVKLFNSLQKDGIGIRPKEKKNFIQGLIKRGLTIEEAEKQYNSEIKMSELFSIESIYTWAPSMKITCGIVIKKGCTASNKR